MVARHDVRDVPALMRVELFLGCAVGTVLVVRAVLAATGYPQVGGSGLHVAHVLWGGLLMGVAITMVLITPGTRARLHAAAVGGIGFGLFIDEVGKFLTKDVNYFFRPAVAVMYAVFVLFYLVAREALLRRPMTDQRRMAVAAAAVGDLALGQLDSAGRDYARSLLDGLPDGALVSTLHQGLGLPDGGPARRVTVGTRVRERLLRLARTGVQHPRFVPGVQLLLLLQVAGMLGQLLLVVLRPDVGLGSGNQVTDVGTEAATVVSAAFAATGGWRLHRGDVQRALRWLYRSALVTLLFTQVFVFVRYQWAGLLGFGAQAVVLGGLRLAIHAGAHEVPDRTGTESA